MENTIYRVDMTEGNTLEFYICGTNEVNPYRKIKEIGVTVFNKEGMQLDASLEPEELESLLEYLRNCQRHIDNFNRKSKAEELTDKE